MKIPRDTTFLMEEWYLSRVHMCEQHQEPAEPCTRLTIQLDENQVTVELADDCLILVDDEPKPLRSINIGDEISLFPLSILHTLELPEYVERMNILIGNRVSNDNPPSWFPFKNLQSVKAFCFLMGLLDDARTLSEKHTAITQMIFGDDVEGQIMVYPGMMKAIAFDCDILGYDEIDVTTSNMDPLLRTILKTPRMSFVTLPAEIVEINKNLCKSATGDEPIPDWIMNAPEFIKWAWFASRFSAFRYPYHEVPSLIFARNEEEETMEMGPLVFCLRVADSITRDRQNARALQFLQSLGMNAHTDGELIVTEDDSTIKILLGMPYRYRPKHMIELMSRLEARAKVLNIERMNAVTGDTDRRTLLVPLVKNACVIVTDGDDMCECEYCACDSSSDDSN
jgi:hypothetical protein